MNIPKFSMAGQSKPAGKPKSKAEQLAEAAATKAQAPQGKKKQAYLS